MASGLAGGGGSLVAGGPQLAVGAAGTGSGLLVGAGQGFLGIAGLTNAMSSSSGGSQGNPAPTPPPPAAHTLAKKGFDLAHMQKHHPFSLEQVGQFIRENVIGKVGSWTKPGRVRYTGKLGNTTVEMVVSIEENGTFMPVHMDLVR